MSRRGRKRDPERLQQDMIIRMVLSSAEPDLRDAPGRIIVGGQELPRFKSVSQAARYLSNRWAEGGFHMDWQVIRSRYNVLKKARPDPDTLPEYVKKRF